MQIRIPFHQLTRALAAQLALSVSASEDTPADLKTRQC